MDHIPLSLREDEHREFEELLSDVHELIDPDMDLSQLLGTVHDKAVAAFRGGSLEPDELRVLLHETIAGDVVEENRRKLPEDPHPDDLMPVGSRYSSSLSVVVFQQPAEPLPARPPSLSSEFGNRMTFPFP